LAAGKIYRGAYSYYRNENIYCEETFEVYKDSKEMGFNFVVQLISRVSTGELLKIAIDYSINKNYIPTQVFIDRTLGNEEVKETYTFDNKNNKLKYCFESKKEKKTVELSTGPIFHISTPCVCTSMLFLKSKKFNNTGKNHYTIYNSNNQWAFEKEPVGKNILVEKISQSAENISIDGSTLQATQYKVFEDLNEIPLLAKNESFIRVFTSSYATIPYIVRTEDGTKIQVKYLNDLTEAEI